MRYLQGSGFVVARGGVVALLTPRAPEELVAEIWDLAASATRHTGVLGAILARGFVAVGDFAVAVAHGDQRTLVLRGDVGAVVGDGEDMVTLTGRGTDTWLERQVPVHATVTLYGGSAPAAGAGLPLVAGVVRAQGAMLGPAAGDGPTPSAAGREAAEVASLAPGHGSPSVFAPGPGPLSTPAPVRVPHAPAAASDSELDASRRREPQVTPEAATDPSPAVAPAATGDGDLVDRDRHGRPERTGGRPPVPRPDGRIAGSWRSKRAGALDGAATGSGAGAEAGPVTGPEGRRSQRAPSTDGLPLVLTAQGAAGAVDAAGAMPGTRVATAVTRAKQSGQPEQIGQSGQAGHPASPFAAPAPGAEEGPDDDTLLAAGLPALAYDPASLAPRQFALRLVTGERVPLDRSVLVGRAPHHAATGPGRTPPRLLVVPSPNGDISRTHARIEVVDGNVLVTDLESTNGLQVKHRYRPPVRPRPGVPTTVDVGSVIDLGDGVHLTVEVQA